MSIESQPDAGWLAATVYSYIIEIVGFEGRSCIDK